MVPGLKPSSTKKVNTEVQFVKCPLEDGYNSISFVWFGLLLNIKTANIYGIADLTDPLLNFRITVMLTVPKLHQCTSIVCQQLVSSS